VSREAIKIKNKNGGGWVGQIVVWPQLCCQAKGKNSDVSQVNQKIVAPPIKTAFLGRNYVRLSARGPTPKKAYEMAKRGGASSETPSRRAGGRGRARRRLHHNSMQRGNSDAKKKVNGHTSTLNWFF
jgi:hypothetical protein